MPTTATITLDMLIKETQRIRRQMLKAFPQLVKDGKVTPYQRDHRLRCNEKLLNLLLQAQQNKTTNGPKLLEILKQQP